MSRWFKVTMPNYLNHNHTRSRRPKHVSLARVPNPQVISHPHLTTIWTKNPKNHTPCEPSMFQRRLNHFEIAQFSNYLQLNSKARPVISSSDQKANRSFRRAIFPSKLVQSSPRSSSSGLPTGVREGRRTLSSVRRLNFHDGPPRYFARGFVFLPPRNLARILGTWHAFNIMGNVSSGGISLEGSEIVKRVDLQVFHASLPRCSSANGRHFFFVKRRGVFLDWISFDENYFDFCFCCQIIYDESFSNSCIWVYFIDTGNYYFLFSFFGVIRRLDRFLVFLEIY